MEVYKETLPKGWTIAKFEDLLDYIQPTNYIVKSTDYKDTYPTPVLTAGKSFIKGYTNETEGIFTKLPTIIFDDFTTATQFVNFPFKVKSSAMKILQSTCDLVNIKLAYYLMQIQNIKGETHKRFWISEYSQLPVPLAPLNEQKRIIDKIEELITDLNKGIEYLETTQKQLKIYRQAVLKFIFESVQNPDSRTVEYCCTHVVDCLHSTAKFEKSGLYCVDTTCIEDGKILFEHIRYVDESTFKERISRLKPEYGDVLFAREGTVGTTLIVPKDIDICLGQRMMMFRLKKDIKPKYFMYYFQSPLFKAQYRPLIGGTTSPHLNIGDIRKFNVITCSPSEQERIIHQIESRLSVCDKIEETIENSLQQAKALRLSIIKKAFEGKLVPQNPSDEPAEKLLERIRAAKGNGKPEKKEKLKANKETRTKKRQ